MPILYYMEELLYTDFECYNAQKQTLAYLQDKWFNRQPNILVNAWSRFNLDFLA